jgi:hypothetical protein
MIISDKKGHWRFKTDGTPKNTVINCQDPEELKAIETIGPESIFRMLTFPQYWLAMLFRDDLYPQAYKDNYTLDQMLSKWSPWLTTNVGPRSYTFWDNRGGEPDFTFLNGHFYRFRLMERLQGKIVGRELVSIIFGKPVQTSGFWYPTDFSIRPEPTPWPYPEMEYGRFIPPRHWAKGGSLHITLSTVSVVVK